MRVRPPRFSPLFRSDVPGHNHSRGDEFFRRSPPQRRRSPEIQAEPQEIPMAYVVRYGRMRFLGEYTAPEDQEHFRGQRVVIRTDRGTELGEILCPATERTAKYLEQSVPGEILRPATHEDLEQEAMLI